MTAHLAAVFREASAEPEGAPDLGERLAALVSAVQRAHPRIELDAPRFVRRLAQCRPKGAPLDAWLGSLHAADLYLACACAEGIPAALDVLEREHLSLVPTYLAGMRPADDFVDDVAQALRERLLVRAGDGPPRIAEYAGRGALGSWLRVVTVRLALERRRKRTEELGGDEGAEAAAAADPELELLKRRYEGELNAAFRAAVGALTGDQRRLLRMHFVEGATLDALGVTWNVHRATVARWLAAARQEILAGARRRLGEKLSLRPAELESLMGVMRSRIDLRLSSAFSPVS